MSQRTSKKPQAVGVDAPGLFSPIHIGKVEIKNRIIMPAMILNYHLKGYELEEEWYRFYARAARGGSGLICCGATYTEMAGKQDEHQLGADTDEWLPALTRIADTIRENGAKSSLQLNHAGRYSWESVTGCHPVAPSPIYTRYTKLVPRELTIDEIEVVIDNFATAALRAKTAGFDAVELLGATGYLISQFMSPLTNERSDKYGGDFDKRLTFVRELVHAIKAKTGDDYPLMFRISSADLMEGGLDADDERRVAVKLVEWGVDMLNVTAGWHDSPVHQIGPSVPHGAYVPLAAKIKAEVDVPVSCAFPHYRARTCAGTDRNRPAGHGHDGPCAAGRPGVAQQGQSQSGPGHPPLCRLLPLFRHGVQARRDGVRGQSRVGQRSAEKDRQARKIFWWSAPARPDVKPHAYWRCAGTR